jgi:hypothetical protein
MSARDDVLGRVRQALVDVAPGDSVSVPRPTVPGQGVDDLVGLFAQRVADYRASVRRCSPRRRICGTRRADRRWRPARRAGWLSAGAIARRG